MKFKNLLQILVVSIVLFSCGSNNDNFNAEAQAVTDEKDLVEYLQTHYLNDDGAIWTITNNETSLMDDSRLSIKNVESNDIKYKLYTLKTAIGASSKSPSQVDSVLVTYSGMLLDSTVFDSSNSQVWFALSSLVGGWGYGLQDFKAGEVVTAVDESFSFENSGEGYLFIPSGLGYGNVTKSIIPENSPLVFKIKMNDVKYVDNDLDGVLSKDEDINNDGNLSNDDSDNDLIPNYKDMDDDGDGVLTINELENKKYLDPNK